MRKGVIISTVLLFIAFIGISAVYSTELKHDAGIIGECKSMSPNGHVVLYNFPSGKGTIDMIKVFGQHYGGDGNLRIDVWNSKLDTIATETYPYNTFTGEYSWIELDFPDADVEGDFYVAVFTDSTESTGVYICMDEKPNKGSFIYTPNKEVTGVTGWTITNWAIRVDGSDKPRIVVLANSIDYGLASDFFGFLKNRGIETIRVEATDFDNYKNEKFIVILGGPDAPEGVGEIVQEILSGVEQNSIREKGARKKYTKVNVWAQGQRVTVLAGSDRAQTKGTHEENKDSVASDTVSTPTTTQPPTTTAPPQAARIEETDPSFVWTISKGNWVSEQSSLASGGTWKKAPESMAAGPQVDITFTGTGISLIHGTCPNCAKARTEIDGVPYDDIDMYSPEEGVKTTMIAEGLSNTEHVLKVYYSMYKNPDAKGWAIIIDAVDITTS